MRLLVIRHAPAVERAEFATTGKNDDLRPLTPDGRRKMRRIAKALHSLVGRPDVLVTSPLVRAEETAGILADVYGIAVDDRIDALRPGSRFTMFAAWAADQDGDSTVAIVGHDPHLSGLVSWLMSGDTEPRIALKKGGACLLHFDRHPGRARGFLEWLMLPAQFRMLSD